MVSKKWESILLIFSVLAVISVSALVDKVLRNEMDSNANRNESAPPSDEKKELSNEYSNQTAKNTTKGLEPNITKSLSDIKINNSLSSGSCGSCGSSSGKPESQKNNDNQIPEEIKLLNLWTATLKESGLSNEFIKNHIKINDYKKESFNDETYFRIYITYNLDWINLNIVYPVLVSKKSIFSTITISSTGLAPQAALSEQEIKDEILKNINIFRIRTIISKERYAFLLKTNCFPNLNVEDIDAIKPDFSLADNDLIAYYSDYVSKSENKCAYSIFNLEDEDNKCQPAPCVKIEILD